MQRIKVILAGLRLILALALLSPVIAMGDAAWVSGAAYSQGVIRNIEVVGNRRVEPETVRSYLQFNVGEGYSAAKIDGSIKALFATGLFADVSIVPKGPTVVVTVRENPVINQVAFEGNSEVDTATLNGEVQLKPRTVFTRAKAQADVQRILDVYRRQGLFAASVEPKIIQLEQDRVNLVFEITEGGATKVKGINFVGNHAFSDSQLRDIISTTQQGWFDFLKGTSIYDPDRMNLDRELIRQYYLKNGYADASVTAANAEIDPDGTGFLITFAIDEGALYTFGAVNIESSLPDVEPSAYMGELLTQSGAVYDASQVDKTTEKLTLAVADRGYAFARVRPRPAPDAANRTIAVTYVVDEGPRVYIERINVIGNTRTKDFVIRREFRLAEGDAFNTLMVDRSKKRLQALGIFKNVDIKRRPGSAPDRVVLDVMVEEQSTGELSFGAGYSTNEGVIGDVSISERNLFGNGQFLRLRLAGSFQRMQVDLSFTEPRFLDRNLSAGFDLYYKQLDYGDEAGFQQRKVGGQVRLGFPIAENLWMQTAYSLSRDEIFGVAYNASRAIKEACGATGTSLNYGNAPDCKDNAYWTSLVGTTIAYDKRNHPTNPTRGFYLEAGTDFAGLGGDAQYVRFNAEARGYYPITEKITFVGRAIGGTIQGWGGEDVRLLDAFFKGGETVRGFDRAGYGPRDLTPGGRFDALGGQTYWAATAEVRFPLPFVPEDMGLSGAFFADAGSLFDATGGAKTALSDPTCAGPKPGVPCKIGDSSSIRSSVGGSLMWNSPVGPLRMDFAKVLTKESYDETQFFRFGASTKF
ncbi:outer membrane protein assembly factor BamA [Hyphomicrobium methylovorum]|uniref:outer membrane protein assembly factor BamA n=1 Tax=Hyphomicrobium methylovorum TaxID=84 RepID=UPI0015E7940B|nr:outer membrane protein assembly factor BamA [Hyphomicrobium methylovorum]MBA2125119.1 outer membrane protein assembly factor BamA [Hyphomicrobium methylovorum]